MTTTNIIQETQATQRSTSTVERLAAIEAERTHLATKVDIERMNSNIQKQINKLLAWLIATQIALFLALAALINALVAI